MFDNKTSHSADAFLLQGVNSRAELVPLPRAYAYNAYAQLSRGVMNFFSEGHITSMIGGCHTSRLRIWTPHENGSLCVGINVRSLNYKIYQRLEELEYAYKQLG
jgi:hypothetical protein